MPYLHIFNRFDTAVSIPQSKIKDFCQLPLHKGASRALPQVQENPLPGIGRGGLGLSYRQFYAVDIDSRNVIHINNAIEHDFA